MAARTDTFDLGRLRLSSGEGRRLTLGVKLGSFDYGGTQYAVEPEQVDATLDTWIDTHAGLTAKPWTVTAHTVRGSRVSAS